MARLNYSKIASRVLSEQPDEKKISEYKHFYKEHLLKLKNKDKILQELRPLCINFFSYKLSTLLSIDREKIAFEKKAINFLSQNFSQEVVDIFEKKLPRENSSSKFLDDKPLLAQLLLELLNVPKEFNNHEKKEWEYKANFLIFLYNCLHETGLHALINKREIQIYKRYNLIIEHDFKSRTKQIDYKALIKLEQLQHEYLTPYERKAPVLINGKLIPLKNICQFKVTSSLLLNDEIELFAIKTNFSWTNSLKDELAFVNACSDETDMVLKNPFLSKREPLFRNMNVHFVDLNRIKELAQINSDNFDVIKLVQLCKELNQVSTGDTFIIPSLLVRAIIDHVPPIFGCKNFSEVANSYKGGTKSFKKAMITLDNSLRNIADNTIHSQIRKKEVLPASLQSDFTPELDLLLSEIVRILK